MPPDRTSRNRHSSDKAAGYKEERDALRTEREEMRNKISSLEDKQRRIEEEARKNDSRAKRKEGEVARLEAELKKLQASEREGNNHLKAAKHELSMAESHHEETKRLLKMKVEELDGMYAFTRKADQVSVADVIDLVKALNAKTSQVAAFISDPQHLPSSEDQVSDQAMSEAVEAVKGSLGEEIVKAIQILKALKAESHPEDPTAVQLTLQIALTGFCEKIINAWTPDRPLDTNEWLTSMYEKIRATESQAIAGRWRALTRAQMGVKDSNSIMEPLMNLLVDVLTGIGCPVQADKFRENFQNNLAGIVDQIVRIQTTAGVSVTSMDVMPYSCPPGMKFKTDYMEDMYASGRAQVVGDDVIVGTTELGLWQKEKTDTAGQFEGQYTPLHKASVVLESALRE